MLKQYPGQTLLLGNNYPYRLAFYERKYARDLNITDLPDHPNAIGETPYLQAIQQELTKHDYAQIICTDTGFFAQHEQFLDQQGYILQHTLKNQAGVAVYFLKKK